MTVANLNTTPLQALDLDERQARQTLIDPVLTKLGWKNTALERDMKIEDERGSKTYPRIADYAFYVQHPRKGRVVGAFMKVKRTSLPPDYGLEQAKLYADFYSGNLKFVYATNGIEFVQFDREKGTTTSPFPIAQFPKPDALLNLVKLGNTQLDKSPLTDPASLLDKKYNGDSEVWAGNAAKLLIPDEKQRLALLEVMADSIQFTHAADPGKWETVLSNTGHHIRFNIGTLEAFALYRNIVHMMVDYDALSEQQRYEIERNALLSDRGIYKSVASSASIDFRPVMLPILLPLVIEAHHSLLKIAAGKLKPRANTRNVYSPGVIDYLRKETKRRIPHPIFA